MSNISFEDLIPGEGKVESSEETKTTMNFTDLVPKEEVKAPTKPIFDYIDPSTSYTSALGATIQEAGAGGGKFLNALSLGIPEYILKKFGYHLPEARTKAGKILHGAAELGGFIAGPAKIAGKVVSKLPVIAKAFKPAKTMVEAVAKPILRSASTLGIAQGIMTPEEGGFLNPKERALQVKRGAQMGALFGSISFIPNKIARILTSSAVIGVPSTLSNQPLEQQVFDYGLGAFFGRSGGSPKQVLARERAIIKRVKYGTDKEGKFLEDNIKSLKENENLAEVAGADPMSRDARFKEIVRRGNTSSLLSLANDILLGKLNQGTPVRKSKAKTKVIKGKKTVENLRLKQLKKAETDWKKNVINDIKIRALKLKKNTNFQLEMGEMDFMVDYIIKDIGKKKSSLKAMDKVQLSTVRTVLNTYSPELPSPFIKPPPLKAVFADGNWSKKISPWDVLLRHGLPKSEKLGYGSITGGGLTNELYDSGTAKAKYLNRFNGLISNWKSVTGLSKTRSEDMFGFMNGEVSTEYIKTVHGEKTVKVLTQMRSYLKTLLKHQNRSRAMYGEEPIKATKHYITRLFEGVVKEIQAKKYPTPDWLIEVLPYIGSKKVDSKFHKTRKGAKGYQRDIWKALNAYTYSAVQTMEDLPVRRAYKIDKFLGKQIAADKKAKVVSKYDLVGVREQTRKYIEGLQGKPGSLDTTLRGMIDPVNAVFKLLPGQPQIHSINDITDGMVSLLYGTQMAYNPSLPIRNLGQHSLIIAQTGFKPLLWAVKSRNTPEARGILKHCKLLASRPAVFGPESQALSGQGIIQKATRPGMIPFKAADRANVISAYLAGYKFAKDNPKIKENPYDYAERVAGLTEFIYLPENRSALAHGFGVSKTGGRLASVFTTWPVNWVELQIASAKNENTRMNLMKYWAVSLAISGLSATVGIRGSAYTGIESPAALLNILRGQLPITGMLGKSPKQMFTIQGVKKLMAFLNGDKSLKETLLYTFK